MQSQNDLKIMFLVLLIFVIMTDYRDTIGVLAEYRLSLIMARETTVDNGLNVN